MHFLAHGSSIWSSDYHSRSLKGATVLMFQGGITKDRVDISTTSEGKEYAIRAQNVNEGLGLGH